MRTGMARCMRTNKSGPLHAYEQDPEAPPIETNQYFLGNRYILKKIIRVLKKSIRIEKFNTGLKKPIPIEQINMGLKKTIWIEKNNRGTENRKH